MVSLPTLAAVAMAQAAPTRTDAPPPIGVAVMCDPAGFRFSIRANATAADLDRRYPVATFVAVDDLFFADGLPGRNGGIEIRGPLTRYIRCGPWTFRLQGDAYNMNVQGEAGAYDPFASLTILRAASQFYPVNSAPLRLTDCDRHLSRAAPCPTGYAVRLDGRYDNARKVVHLVETASSYTDDEIAKPAGKTLERRIDVPEDLAVWHPD